MAMAELSRAELLAAAIEIAHEAGKAIMVHYRDQPKARLKADSSPVTAADEEAESLIVEGLSRLTSAIPIVSEEAVAAGAAPAIGGASDPSRKFWLVDPLDGTVEFLAGNGEFTVNIALIEGDRPVLGVVHIPALDTTYAADGPGRAFVRRHGEQRSIAARVQPADGAIVLSSRSHGNDEALERYLASHEVQDRRIAGSALKFCLVAEGVADLYPRLGRTMEWDTAAGQAVLVAAGGSVATLDDRELRYGKPQFENPHFIARGKPRAA
jgi:3'(2'), 5'-bisphosphate nucleotidase